MVGHILRMNEGRIPKKVFKLKGKRSKRETEIKMGATS
jgi:hypothetical protein